MKFYILYGDFNTRHGDRDSFEPEVFANLADARARMKEKGEQFIREWLGDSHPYCYDGDDPDHLYINIDDNLTWSDWKIIDKSLPENAG